MTSQHLEMKDSAAGVIGLASTVDFQRSNRRRRESEMPQSQKGIDPSHIIVMVCETLDIEGITTGFLSKCLASIGSHTTLKCVTV